MKTQWINHRLSSYSITFGILAFLGSTLLLAPYALAARHTVVTLDDTFVDTDSFCVPVLAHTQGKLILGTDFPRLTVVQSFTTEWTNLETGKTAISRTVGQAITRFESETVVTITGAVLIQQRDDTWVNAGLVEFAVEFDPGTSQEINVMIRDAGNHPGSFGEALCTALQ